ncbi:MAG: D-glycero-beta-D-manno-heptose-7-phosphate kinase [Candidatus Omnitrophica bacterium]|nr:D-glycero-beta-D-manno-heptose-7-phosphate kinase [Candidatus Omnitrophota bacterium]MDE2009975.1 D-glycero-beta-D-manno-heptose-7-phosphate kinase [Candidatus Omnitrophota bacterium]MDE2213953.1 D-glycero-beta-D-manno-heptose-7-phosphate kinase [Candidatus Omnitrophota bacterium]MDE2231897.1 D-glycero-beta-D-manno-heptose-7-phosphate kinase [Candidatus Omnitrophota bacterium]
MSKYNSIIRRFKGRRLLVIGDVVLDQYIKGSVSRISPEAPVPIVLQEESFYTPGGAANVANNLASLGADVTLVGRIGDDLEGAILRRELIKRRIHTKGIFIDSRTSTIFKARIIAQHQQIVRLDREKPNRTGLDVVKEGKILPFLRRHLKDFEVVVISDYGKDMIDPGTLAQVHELALRYHLPVVVDPKLEDLREYGQVTCITPNKKEAEAALKSISTETRKAFGICSTRLDAVNDIEANGCGLLNFLGIQSLLITLGEHGMYLFERDKKPLAVGTVARQVFDVSGAGDTVIAAFALCLAAGADKSTAARIANYAAGVVVGKMGAVAVELDELKRAVGAI